jgi:eukaryotic-like serine/threonine-protein kinase
MAYDEYLGDEPTVRPTSEADLLLPGGAALLTTKRFSRKMLDSDTSGEESAASSAIFLEGKLRLEEEIGSGGMGTVFRARDISLGRDVAVKFLLPELQDDIEAVVRFRREARAMAAVRHENVVQIHSFGQQSGADFFVMEFIEGESLEDYLLTRNRRGRPTSIPEVLRLLDGACAGLGAIHDAGLVHRDIKPSNLMLESSTGRVVIMDFGLGRGRKEVDSPRREKNTGGTPGYMAPETIAGRPLESWEEVLTDIYAFGVTAYELLTGRTPFSGENWAQLFQRHLQEDPEPPSSVRPDIPPAIDELLLKCLSREPMERFQWCDELRGAIQTVMTAVHAHSILPETPPPASPRPRRGSYKTPSEDLRGPRILVVGDDLEARNVAYEATCAALPDAHFRAARSAMSAFALALESPPLVIIASLHDEQINGLELAATIHSEPSLRNVELILTARALSDGDRLLLETISVTCILPEPLSRGVLEGALRQFQQSASKSADDERTAT